MMNYYSVGSRLSSTSGGQARSAKEGFTLIELLVVIAIIGLLSTLAVLSLSGFGERARDTVRATDIAAFQKAMSLIYQEQGHLENTCTGGYLFECNDDGPVLENYLPSLSTMKDPSDTGDACSCGSSTGPCEYFFDEISGTDYTLHFWMEGSLPGTPYTTGGCYEAWAVDETFGVKLGGT